MAEWPNALILKVRRCNSLVGSNPTASARQTYLERCKMAIALFDLDGTLADYSGQICHDYEALRYPEEPRVELDFHEDAIPYVRARLELIKRQPRWWANLPKFKLGFDILDIAHAVGFDIYISTKGPSTKPAAWAEKLEWCHANIRRTIHWKMIVSEDKSLVYGRVFVDDWPPYLEAWLEHRPRGLCIMPAHPYNKSFEHSNVVRYDGKNYVEVAERLEEAYKRD